MDSAGLSGQWAAQTTLKDKQQRVAQVVYALGVAMGFAAQSGQVATQAIVHALDGVGVRFALEVLTGVKDGVVAGVLVGGVSDCSAARNLRTQCAGCWGVAITQDPAENSLGRTINSPPQPNCSFFSPT
jgi:hypothetical protein